MAGLSNLKGKKAAPFTRGGGRSKTHPNDAHGKKRKQARAALAKAKAYKADLAVGVSGNEIDLDWSKWNAEHKGERRAGISRREVRNFKKFAGVKGKSSSAAVRSALEARAAKPGHFRAKAILAAENGNIAAARKYQAKRVARLARQRRASAPAKAPTRAPATSTPKVRSAPPAPPTRRPARARKTGVKRRFRAAAMAASAHAAAIRKDRGLSRDERSTDVDLALGKHFRYRHGWIKIGSEGDNPHAGADAAKAAVRKQRETWQASYDKGYADAKAGKAPGDVGSGGMDTMGYQRGYAKFHEESRKGVTSEELTRAVEAQKRVRQAQKRIAAKENYTARQDSFLGRLKSGSSIIPTFGDAKETDSFEVEEDNLRRAEQVESATEAFRPTPASYRRDLAAKMRRIRAKSQSPKEARKTLGLATKTDGSVDLATLTSAARDALPASAFVFPKKRAYPIHDKSHAANALARSKGKPEHAAVAAAVRRRYPEMGK